MSSTAAMETTTSKPEAKKPCNKKLWGLLGFIACVGGTVGGVVGGLSAQKNVVKGTWKTNFGSHVTITDTTWYTVSSWGKSANDVKKITGGYVITQNAATDAFNPSKFVKNEYHTIATGWAYCSSVFDAATLAAAEAKDTTAIYKKDDKAKGCNGFGFTEMTAYANPLIGNWKTNFGEKIAISATEWKNGDNTASKIEAVGDGWILKQNPADDKWNPSKWQLINWHKVGNDYAYCTSVMSGATAAAALTTDVSTIYDKANAASGCNGFSHSIMSAA